MLHAAVVPSLPASAVTHSVSGCFSSSLPEGLSEVVVVCENHITLYQHANGGTDSLHQVMELSLYAPPVGVATCRPMVSPVDLLVLLFDDFHLSFMHFRPLVRQWQTVALVQFDNREYARERCSLPPILRADPTGSYVAVLSKRRELFILPVLRMGAMEDGDMEEAAKLAEQSLNEEARPAAQAAKPRVDFNAWGDEDEADETTDNGRHAEVTLAGNSTGTGEVASATGDTSFVSDVILRLGSITRVALDEIKSTLRNVRDFHFVESTGEPLLAFLYEKHPTWAGRVKLMEWRSKTVETQMLTCSILWTKLTLGKSPSAKLLPIGDVDNIPYTTTHMAPIAAFQQVPSGVLCFSGSSVLYVTTMSGYGAYINDHGAEEARSTRSSSVLYEPMQWSDRSQASSTELIKVNLNLAGCVAIPLSCSSKEDDLNVLIITEEEGVALILRIGAEGYFVNRITSTLIMTGCFCSAWAHVGKSLYFLGTCKGDSRLVSVDHSSTEPITAMQTFVGLGAIQDVTVLTQAPFPRGEEEHNDAGGNDGGTELSPYADLFRNVSIDPEPQLSLAERRAVSDLAVCSGLEASGSLCVLRHSIRNTVIRRETLNGISAFFLDASDCGGRKRPRDTEEREGPVSTTAAPGAHLLITGIGFSILFAIRSDSVQHVRGTALSVNARTVYAAAVDWLQALLQVTESELRLVSLDGKRKLHQTNFTNVEDGGLGKVRAVVLVPTDMCLLLHFENNTVSKLNLSGLKSIAVAEPWLENVSALAVWESRRQVAVIQGMNLSLINVAEGEQAAVFPNFAVLPPTAVEGVETILPKLPERLNKEPLPHVTHMEIFEHPGRSSSCVNGVECSLVFITSSGEMQTYQMVGRDAQGPQRLLKAAHHFLDIKVEREFIETIEEKKRRLHKERTSIEQDTQLMRQWSTRLISFTDVGGYSGVYVCGQNPVFLLYDAQRDQLVPYRHQAPGTVRGFTPFHSRHVEGGYVYCCEGYVEFATADRFGRQLGDGWLMERVPLGATPHRVVFSGAAQSCFVITSTKEPFSPKKASFDVQLKVVYDEEGEKTTYVEEPFCLPPMSPSGGVPVVMNDRYSVKFISCNDWRCTDELVLEENEKVLSASCVRIARDTSMDTVPQAAVAPVCVLGTAFPLGEDVTSRGRLILLASKHVQEERKIWLLHSEPLKGPVTAVADIQGHIAVAVGGTVRVFHYDIATKKLVTMAILYAGAYVTHLSAFRDYLVYGDLYHSTAMARYSASNHTLTVLGKDTNHFSVVQNEMLFHDRAFAIVASDDLRNVALFGYTPRVLEAGSVVGKTQKVLEAHLTLDGEYRMAGGCLVKLLRFRSLTTPSCSSVYVTNFGEIGFIVPLGNQTNRTAQWVVRRLHTELPHPAGLPPRMFLGIQQEDPKYALVGKEKLLHAPLLQELFRLDLRTRKAVAAAALTQLDRAMNVGASIAEDSALF